MVELVVVFAIVAMIGFIIVKIYEWLQDVLHVPHLRRGDRIDIR
jgi:hypothetical protein